MEMRDRVFDIMKTEMKRDENGVFYISKGFEDDKQYFADYEFIRTKLVSLVNKLNSLHGEELGAFLDKDFQNEVYDTL